MYNRRRKSRNLNEKTDNLESYLISTNRVVKVVKGGRTLRFTALVVVGDQEGQVGIGMGKAAEIPEAIRKATAEGKRSLFKVPMVGTTIPHEITGVYGSGKVLLLPAEEGTGVIAGGPVRPILKAAGIKDIRTKIIGTTNPINCAKAVIEGLKSLRTVEEVAALRGKKVEDIIGEA